MYTKVFKYLFNYKILYLSKDDLMVRRENMTADRSNAVRTLVKTVAQLALFFTLLASRAYGAPAALQIMPALGQVQLILASVGPALSGVLFILAGIFYAIGQMLPPDKKAQFHTTSVNIIIGAIVVGALSVASTSLVAASSHLLANLTVNGTANGITT